MSKFDAQYFRDKASENYYFKQGMRVLYKTESECNESFTDFVKRKKRENNTK